MHIYFTCIEVGIKYVCQLWINTLNIFDCPIKIHSILLIILHFISSLVCIHLLYNTTLLHAITHF